MRSGGRCCSVMVTPKGDSASSMAFTSVGGDTIIPPAYTDYKWNPPPDQAFSFDLQKAGQLLDAAGYKKGSDGLRTMPDGSPIGTLRLAARSDASADTSVNTMDYFKEWLADLGIDAGQVGLASAPSQVASFANKPPRSAGQVVKDEGDGGVKIVEFLASQKLV